MPGKTISNLHVGIGGSFGGLAKTFSGAATATESFVGKLAGIGGTLSSLTGIGAAIGTVTTAAYGAYKSITEVHAAFETLEATGKLADRLGTTTEELTGLQHAARMSGVSADAVSGAMGKMLKALGKAPADLEDLEDGLDTSGDAFGKLGLNSAQLKQQDAAETFKQIADAVSRIENPAERAAAASSIFGKSGASLIPLLAKGAAGIGELQAEAQRLGLTFSRLDAQKVEEANQAMVRLRAVGTGLAQKLAVTLAPIVETLANGFTAMAVKVRPVFEVVFGIISSAFNKIMATATPIVDRTTKYITNAWNMVSPAIATALSTAWGYISSIWETVYNYVAAIATDIYTAVASRWEAIVASVTRYALAIYHVIEAVMGIIGQIVSTVWDAIVQVWQFGVELITGNTEDSAASIDASWTDIIDQGNALRDGISEALNMVEYALKNWQLTAELVGLKVILAIVTLGNQITYVLTEVIPTAIGFVGACLIVKFTNDVDQAMTILSNLASNVVSVFTNLPGLIKGSTKWTDVWTPLTKGFQEAVVEWPGIAEREQGEFEKQLIDEIGNVEDEWTKGLADHLVKRNDEAEKAGKSVVDTMKKIFTLPDAVEPPKIEAPAPIVPKLSTDNLTLTIQPEIKKAGAIRVGSAQDQLLRYAGPDIAGMLAPAGAKGQPAAGMPAKPYAAPVSSPSKGQDDFWAGMKTEWKQQTEWLRKIETNTRTPQFATADI